MPDPWEQWDDRIKESGRPSRLASELSDLELLTLLAVDCGGTRRHEKDILRREALRRLPEQPDSARLIDLLSQDTPAARAEKWAVKDEIYRLL